jgi:hypothetical protein
MRILLLIGFIAICSCSTTGIDKFSYIYNNNGIDKCNELECYCNNNASDYIGYTNITINGDLCEDWLNDSHNYCRNDNYETYVWCYTDIENIQWEYCDITQYKKCDNTISNHYIIASNTTSFENKLNANYVCDGNDDNIEIMKANDKLRFVNGGTIDLLPGIYSINRNININSNIILRGDGIDNTILYLQNNAESWKSSPRASGLIRGKFDNNITVEHLTINGNKENQVNANNVCNICWNSETEYSDFYCIDEQYYTSNITTCIEHCECDYNTYGRFGIYFEVVDNIYLNYVKVMNFNGYGFDPHGKGDTWLYTSNLIINNCESYYNDWDGFTLDKMYNSTMKNSISKYNSRHGINIVTGSYDINIYNNTIESNGFNHKDLGCGIVIQNNQEYNTRYNHIYNNNIVNHGKDAICLNNVHNNYIHDNYIDLARSCIRLYNSWNNTIVNNICNDLDTIQLGIKSINNNIYNNTIESNGFNQQSSNYINQQSSNYINNINILILICIPILLFILPIIYHFTVVIYYQITLK